MTSKSDTFDYIIVGAGSAGCVVARAADRVSGSVMERDQERSASN
jgi:choline dehydrogenase-like flavoprotein